MAIVIKPITVEVSKPNVFQAIAAKQNDSNSRFLKVTFVNEGEKITVPPSAKVTINAERNDGQSNSFFGAVNDDGTAIVPIHSWILELPGYVDCDVSIIEDDSKLTCTTFSLLVEEASHGSDDILEDEQYDVLGELINDVKTLYPPYAKEEIDPVFANNSWELIKAVCQHDDPSKYWKVGDYKMVGLSTVEYVSDVVEGELGGFSPEYSESIFMKWAKENEVGEGYFTVSSSYLDGTSDTETVTEIKQFKENPVDFYEDMANGEIDIEEAEKWIEENTVDHYRYVGWVITPLGKTVCVHYYKQEQVKEYPLQIIGFNHDKVTDPYNYGKQKAGMTLQLGASRNVYGDTKPGLYEGTIDGLMAADGIHFKAPNKVLADYSEGATNWADGGFRGALQTLFDGTEIADLLVEVKKQTSHHWQEGQRWAALMDTYDKVFLPSEYEYFGEVLYAPAKEGEQYELYEEGTSKFMWTTELLEGDISNARIAFRSTVGSKVSTDSDYGGNCGMYLTVKSLSPVSVSYTHSYASADCWIAPCICL